MSWLSDVTNAVNSAVDAVQDVVDTVADAVQDATNAAVDTAQNAVNSGIDAAQGVVGGIAATYDSIFGTSIFAQAAAALNGQVDTAQNVANEVTDLNQDTLNTIYDGAQFIGRDYVDALQYAGTIIPKALDDALGDGSVNQPPLPVAAEWLRNAVA